MSLYEKDPDKYPYLDLSSVDKDRNTLLHLASRANYSKHSHKAVELLMSKDVPVDLKNKEGKLAIDYLKPHDGRTQYLRMAGKQSGAAVAKKNETAKSQSSSPVPFDSRRGSMGRDNEQVLLSKPKSDSFHVDRQGFKAKDAVEHLTTLVGGLSDLTPAEVKLAKTSKGKWLEVENSSQRRQSLSPSDDEEGGAAPTAAAVAAGDGDAQEVDLEEEEEEEGIEEEEEEEKV